MGFFSIPNAVHCTESGRPGTRVKTSEIITAPFETPQWRFLPSTRRNRPVQPPEKGFWAVLAIPGEKRKGRVILTEKLACSASIKVFARWFVTPPSGEEA
ncbi:hypothetical protein KM043_009677 [Ampulex compressa]|nr:hypothetical protein KM043_009677 [Ampulex compressa]